MIGPADQAAAGSLKGSILLVCGANVSRSPVMFALLRDLLPSPVALSSAGVHAATGTPVEARALEALGPTAVALESFRSQRVSRRMLEESDLVLTATRVQRADIVKLSPGCVRITFTLLEFAQLAADVAAMLDRAGEQRPHTVADFVGLVPEVRGRRSLGGSLDLSDPMGGSRRRVARTVNQIDHAASTVAHSMAVW